MIRRSLYVPRFLTNVLAEREKGGERVEEVRTQVIRKKGFSLYQTRTLRFEGLKSVPDPLIFIRILINRFY